jgi:hypothetical protein
VALAPGRDAFPRALAVPRLAAAAVMAAGAAAVSLAR